MNQELTRTLLSGKYIICEGIIRGTHAGPFMTSEGELPATGRKVKIKVAWIAEITPSGLIAEDRSYYDTPNFMKQLGVLKQ